MLANGDSVALVGRVDPNRRSPGGLQGPIEVDAVLGLGPKSDIFGEIGMSGFALLAGRLAATPTRERVNEPNVCAVALLRVAAKPKCEYWRIIGYDSIQAEMLALDVGDAISVSGEMQTRLIERDGAPEIERTLVIRNLLALPPPPTFLREA